MMMMIHEILGALSSRHPAWPSEASAEEPISSWCFWAGLEMGKTHHPSLCRLQSNHGKCKSDPKVVISIQGNLFRCGRAAVFLFGNLWLFVIHVVIHIIMVSVRQPSRGRAPFCFLVHISISKHFDAASESCLFFLDFLTCLYMFLHSYLAFLASPAILSAGSLRKELPCGHFFAPQTFASVRCPCEDLAPSFSVNRWRVSKSVAGVTEAAWKVFLSNWVDLPLLWGAAPWLEIQLQYRRNHDLLRSIFTFWGITHVPTNLDIVYDNIILPSKNLPSKENPPTWGRGWMTKASGVGERREGKRWVAEGLSSSCRGIVRPNEDATMIYWYMIYNNDIYGGGGRGALSREKSRDVLGEPRNTC